MISKCYSCGIRMICDKYDEFIEHGIDGCEDFKEPSCPHCGIPLEWGECPNCDYGHGHKDRKSELEER